MQLLKGQQYFKIHICPEEFYLVLCEHQKGIKGGRKFQKIHFDFRKTVSIQTWWCF